MSKFIDKIVDKMSDDEMLDVEIENIGIEELDKDMEEFYIDREAIENIKAPEEMRLWVREAAEKAQKDMKKEKIKKYISVAAASVCVILTIGVYDPALAHKLPPLEKVLNNINDALSVDEIASFLGIDKIIPKTNNHEDDNTEFIKKPSSEVNKDDEEIIDGEIDTEVEIESKVESENQEVSTFPNGNALINYVHRMVNSIIIPVDNKKYGEKNITPDNIDTVLASLFLVEDEGMRIYLENQLLKWKQGDFDNAVELHNYIWSSLGGDIGRAESLDKKAIKKVKTKYFN